MTPLLAATRDSWHGRPEAVMTLLANGADPRTADSEGNTPLHHAARSSDPGVAALLRDAAAETDALNQRRRHRRSASPASAGNWRLAQVPAGARRQARTGRRPTRCCWRPPRTEEDDPAGVQLLLKHKAKVDTRDSLGRSALHEAALAGHADIIAVLLAAGADVHGRDDAGAHAVAGRRPRRPGCRAGRRWPPPARTSATMDAEGRNALMLACTGESVPPPLVRRLLELGVDPRPADQQGRRAVDLAAEAGRWAIVSALDPRLRAAVRRSATTRNERTAMRRRRDRAPLDLLRDGPAAPTARRPGRAGAALLAAGTRQPAARSRIVASPAARRMAAGARRRRRSARCRAATRRVRTAGARPRSDAGAARAAAARRVAGRRRWPGPFLAASLHGNPSIARARKPSPWNCWNAAPIRSPPRRPATRRCRWRCGWAGCACINPCSTWAWTAKRATATACPRCTWPPRWAAKRCSSS